MLQAGRSEEWLGAVPAPQVQGLSMDPFIQAQASGHTLGHRLQLWPQVERTSLRLYPLSLWALDCAPGLAKSEDT